MRIHFELTLTFGKDTDEPAHLEDHTGYLTESSGLTIGFSRGTEETD